MRFIAALLTAKVRAIAVVGAVLCAKVLLRNPRLNQCAVHGELLVTHKLLRPHVHLREESLRDIARQQAVPRSVLQCDAGIDITMWHKYGTLAFRQSLLSRKLLKKW
jgi:hypothetical protein